MWVYMWPENNVDSVDFYVDGAFNRTERLAPYELDGGAQTTFSSGTHTVRAVVNAPDGNSEEISATFTISATSASEIYEAELAYLNGPLVKSNVAGYSGTGFADYQNLFDDYAEWTVDVAGAGQYLLVFRYGLASGDRPLQISVNGQEVQASLSFPATGSWTSWGLTEGVLVNLNAGSNTIRATAIGSSGANVDYLEVHSLNQPNLPPTAGFTFSTTDLTASFTDTSTDSDGTVSTRTWNLGDGGSSTATKPSHTYATVS